MIIYDSIKFFRYFFLLLAIQKFVTVVITDFANFEAFVVALCIRSKSQDMNSVHTNVHRGRERKKNESTTTEQNFQYFFVLVM